MRLVKTMFLTAMLTGVIWGQTSTTVSTFAELHAAVTVAGVRPITISGNIEVTAPLIIPDGADVTIQTTGSATHTLTLANNVSGSMFTVDVDAKLTMDSGITLVGRSGNVAPVVTVRGTFVMNGGTITGNSSNSTDGAARCGGVGVADGGTFDMLGGAITGNTYTGNGGFGTGAGGVIVGKGAVFNMHGGAISDNTNSYMSSSSSSSSNGAGGVYVSDGTFNMYDGAVIRGNKQTGNFNFAAAGGLYLANISTFNMYGGTITGNSAVSSPSGDGIYNSATSYIELSGAPVIDDGVWFHSTPSAPSFAARLRIGAGGLSDGALIVIQGCTQASQMSPPNNLTAAFTGVTPAMAKAFISRDKKLVGKVQGNRVVWADNFDLELYPATDIDFGTTAYGYDADALSNYSVTIRNIGLGQTNGLSITIDGIGADAFVLSKDTVANILPNMSDNFTVTPKTGLDAGTYTAAVTVTGEYDISISFNVSFTVERAPGAGTVAIAGWTYGGLPNNPTVANAPVDYTGTVAYTYKAQDAGDDAYSTTRPTNAGGYTVRAVFPSVNNYNEHTATANFTISKAPLVVSAVSTVIHYNEPAPVYSVSYSGFVNNENSSVLVGDIVPTSIYTQGYNVGTYDITLSGSLTSVNYNIQLVDGTLTVVQNPMGCAGHVSLTGWTYGASPNTPVHSSTNGAATIIEYKLKSLTDAQYSIDIPEDAGEYTVRATFPQTPSLAGCYATADFTISKARLIIMASASGGDVITYGDDRPDFMARASGFVSGDNMSSLTGTLGYICEYEKGSDAGEYVIKPSGVSSNNYNIEFWDGILTVERYVTTLTVTASGKVYDGNTGATAATASIRYQYDDDGADEIFIIPGTAAFTDKNAGTNKTVRFSGWSLGGTKAHNYSLTQPKNATASITPKPITVRAGNITYPGKVYDGTTAVNRSDVTITLDTASGIVSGDSVTASFASAVFDSKDVARVGEERMITVSGITLQGADAGNYSLINTAAVTGAVIERRMLTAKVENQLVRTDVDPHTVGFDKYTLIGLVESDGDGKGLFGNDNPISFGAGPDITLGHDYWPAGTMTLMAGVYPVTPTGVLNNYIVAPISGILTISDKDDVSGDITLDDLTVVYDGTSKSVTAVYSGITSGDSSYTYQYFGTILSGEEYTLTTTPPTEAGTYFVNVTYEDDDNIGKAAATIIINPKPVTIINVTASDKVYDGDAIAVATIGEIVGVVGVDDVTPIPGTALFADRNAGDNKTVTFDGWSLGGTRAHNYHLLTDQPASVTANITQKPITLHPDDINYDGKVYDGTIETDVAMFVLSSASGLVAGDAAAASKLPNGSALFDSKDAGVRTVTVSGLTLRGPNADNYILSPDPVDKPGIIIEKRDLTIKVDNKLVVVGTAPPLPFTYSVSGLLPDDTLRAATTAYLTDPSSYIVSPVYVGTTTGVSTVTIADGGDLEPNYNIIYQSGILTVSDKTDISGAIVFTNATNATNDTVSVEYDGTPQSVKATYATDTTNFTYRYSGTSLDGTAYNSSTAPTAAGNYSVEVVYEDTANIGKKSVPLIINPKPLAILSAEHTRVYDGTRNAVGIVVNLDEAGIIPADTDSVAIASVSAMYDNPAAGTTAVTITGVTLAGSKAANYIVTVPANVMVAGITSKLAAASVGIENWTYGETPRVPFVYGMPDDYTGTPTYRYKPLGSLDAEYKDFASIDAATLPGDYILEATFPADAGYEEYVTTAVFTVHKMIQPPPYIPGRADHKQAQMFDALKPAELEPYLARVPFDKSGLKMTVSDTGISIIPKDLDMGEVWAGVSPDISDMANWEYRLGGTGSWVDVPVFGSLAPNTEYIIFVRMKETGLYRPSDAIAILVRTSAIGEVPVTPVVQTSSAPSGGMYVSAPATGGDGRRGITLAKGLASDRAEFAVTAAGRGALVNVVIYDKMGNVVFRRSGVKSDENIVWDLKNRSGRGVANGVYLIVATTRAVGAERAQKYSARVMVRR